MRLNERVGGNDKPVGGRVVGQDAARKVHRLRAVVEQLDEIHVGRVGVGQKLVDDNGAIGTRSGRFRPAGRTAHELARRPRLRVALA